MGKISIKTIYLLCSVLLSIVSLFGINSYVQSKVGPEQVWIFTRDLDANSKIQETDIQPTTIPRDAVKDSFFRGTPQDIVGKCVDTDVYADQYILTKQVVAKEDVNPFKSLDTSELRKISIPGNMVSTAGAIKKGDRVDILYHGVIEHLNSDLPETTYGKVFMQNVPVYDVITAEGTGTTTANDVPEGTEFNPFYEYIVLAVTLEQAEEILTRLSKSSFSLISRFEDSESYETEGFAINSVPTSDKLPFIGKAPVESKPTTIIED